MSDETAIAWTQKTWNPWQGCRKVSAGCTNCYMFREKKMYGQNPDVVVRSKPPTFRRPLSKSWKEPALVFTCSWSDFFIEEADGWREEAWEIIRKTPHLTYQILTKRPERFADCLPKDWGNTGFRNVWLGVTAEDQRAADQRIPFLLETPAAVRFISCEPLLGPVRLETYLGDLPEDEDGGPFPGRIGWVIVGGESGPKARPCNLPDIRDVVMQCAGGGTRCFVKQLGARPLMGSPSDHVYFAGDPEKRYTAARNGSDPTEWPHDLRVRQIPEVPCPF